MVAMVEENTKWYSSTDIIWTPNNLKTYLYGGERHNNNLYSDKTEHFE